MTLPTVHGEFRTGGDPELRFSPSGVPVCSVRAVASKRKNTGTRDNPEWVDDKQAWVNLTFFNQQAENVAESIERGMLVTVIGELEVQEYEKRDGGKGTSVNVIVRSMGPSLSYATAKVTKSERGGGQQQRPQSSQGGGGNQQQRPADNDPWAVGQDEPPF